MTGWYGMAYDQRKYKLCLCPPRWSVQPHFCHVMVHWNWVSCDICGWQSMQLLKYLIVKGDHCPTSIPLNILSALLSERMVFEFIERLTHIASQGHDETEWHYSSRILLVLMGPRWMHWSLFFFFFFWSDSDAWLNSSEIWKVPSHHSLLSGQIQFHLPSWSAFMKDTSCLDMTLLSSVTYELNRLGARNEISWQSLNAAAVFAMYKHYNITLWMTCTTSNVFSILADTLH